MAPRGLLLLGTDTGVGKTALAQGLLRLARRRSFRLVPYKPVETGCAPLPADAEKLLAAADLPGLTVADVCPFPLPLPVAPSVAARLSGAQIQPGALAARAALLGSRGDAILVESAGGLLTPYAPGFTSASLADLLAIDVLLVAANRLGTINHTALALTEVARRRLPLAGLVLVQVASEPEPDHPHNASEITALTGVVPLGLLRHCPSGDPDDLADAVEQDLRLDGLLSGALRGTAKPP